MLKCVQIICAKYYELRCMFYKKDCTSSKLEHLLDTASKFALFLMSGLKDTVSYNYVFSRCPSVSPTVLGVVTVIRS